MTTNHITTALFSLIVVALLFIIARYKFGEYRKRRKQRKRFERGRHQEIKAKDYLIKKGYAIVSSQKSYTHTFEVDGENVKAELIPDYVVKKNGKIYLVEVKTGKSAINIQNRNTRRQILEYDFVIDSDGIFLLDMENLEMKRVRFFTKKEQQSSVKVVLLIGIALVGIFIPSWYIKGIAAVLLGIVGYKDILRKFS
jgi:Holliday junction resolvase-like predicted endonuclease